MRPLKRSQKNRGASQKPPSAQNTRQNKIPNQNRIQEQNRKQGGTPNSRPSSAQKQSGIPGKRKDRNKASSLFWTEEVQQEPASDFMAAVEKMDPLSKKALSQSEMDEWMIGLDPKQILALANSNLSDVEFWAQIAKMRAPSILLEKDSFSFEKWKKWTIWLPAFLIAFFTIAGELFLDYPSWDFSWLIQNPDLFFVRLLWLIVLFCANALSVQAIYAGLEQGKKILKQPAWMRRKKGSRQQAKHTKTSPSKAKQKGGFWKDLQQTFEAYPTLCFFFLLFLAFVPDLVISSPGKMMGDTYDQLKQVLVAGTGLNSHHSVVHTLLMGSFVKFGIWIGSPAAGAVLYTLLQAIVVEIALAMALTFLYKEGFRKTAWIGVLLYYISSPVIYSYLTLWTKDVLYGAFFLMFVLAWYQVLFGLRQKSRPAGWYMILFLSAFMIMVLRSEGMYIVVLSAAAGLLLKRFRTACLVLLVFCGSVHVLLNFAFYPILDVEVRKERQESLSIPFQQTARFLRDSDAPITQEQRDAIAAILDYQNIPLVYNPKRSDEVKSTYKGTDEDLPAYFKAWAEMFFADPEVCFMAWLEMYYEYLDPFSVITNTYTYAWSAQKASDIYDEYPIDLSTPNYLRPAQYGIEAFYDFLLSLPVYSAYLHPAFFMWTGLLLLLYVLHKKQLHLLIFFVPMLVNMLVIFASPVNGYYGRYQYPMMLYLPVLLLMTMKLSSMELPALKRRVKPAQKR